MPDPALSLDARLAALRAPGAIHAPRSPEASGVSSGTPVAGPGLPETSQGPITPPSIDWSDAPPAPIEDERHTHASVVLLTPQHAWKLKRPVDLGFLDYSTLGKRLDACREEVRLNRRLAPGIYLGVAPIVREPSGRIRMLAPDAEVPPGTEQIDAAVVMRRLPEARMLDVLLDHAPPGSPVRPEDLAPVVDRLVQFHAGAASGPDAVRYSTPAALAAAVEENLAGLAGVAPGSAVCPPAWVRFLRARAHRFLDQHAALLRRRIDDGRVRDLHGDLHARNICLSDDGPVLFDCIEFSRALRCRDVAAEIAFLSMDLAHRGRPDLAAFVETRYAAATGDAGLPRLLPFYRMYYAIVRAKVEGLRATAASDVGTGTDAFRSARRFARRAVGEAMAPAALVLCGLPGSGKSGVTRLIERDCPVTVLASDVVRKALMGVAVSDRSGHGARGALYTEDVTRRVYQELARRGAEACSAGGVVVYDATSPTKALRSILRDSAAQAGAPSIVVHLVADPQETRRRLERRSRDPAEPSDADWRVYLAAAARFETPDPTFEGAVITLDTTRTDEESLLDALLARILHALDQACP
ncbi:MAG: AAA family ATPase [Phycisphaeraceae bacterium]|nr:AAA family ATPase [Phycisphaeraceae bacterium]